MPKLPRRIDCFDISTIQGSETVASMVVCEEGRMRPSEYRKFKIKQELSKPQDLKTSRTSGTSGPQQFLDDFAAMEQVVRRRYAKVLENGGPFPDLIVIDGGKGQLNAAYAALETVGLSNLVAIGLAKKEELVFTRDSMEPLALDPHGNALRLLQRIRDEAHRFAITFHRQSRKQARSAVGARRRARHRPAAAKDAADRVRQPVGRPPRHPRRAGAGRRREGRRRCDRALRGESVRRAVTRAVALPSSCICGFSRT